MLLDSSISALKRREEDPRDFFLKSSVMETLRLGLEVLTKTPLSAMKLEGSMSIYRRRGERKERGWRVLVSPPQGFGIYRRVREG